jgi:hypothetical protein
MHFALTHTLILHVNLISYYQQMNVFNLLACYLNSGNIYTTFHNNLSKLSMCTLIFELLNTTVCRI